MLLLWLLAALLLLSRDTSVALPPMPPSARVLVVGAGSISREFALNHFTPEATGTVVAGIVDSDQRRARDLAAEVGSARQPGARIATDGGNKYRSRVVIDPRDGSAGAVAVPFYTSIDDALSTDGDGIDVVYIGTPPGSHRPLVERAFESGKHILLEKPLASTPEDADAIVAAAEKAWKKQGVVLGMNIGMRYNAALEEMRRRILENDEFGIAKGENSGLVGALRLHFRQWPREWQTQPWCASRSEGGPCREVGTHFFAALLEFASGGKASGNDRTLAPIDARIKATVEFPSSDVYRCESSAAGTIELKGGSLPPGGLEVDFTVLTKSSLPRDLYELKISRKGDAKDAGMTLFDFCSLRNDHTGEVLVENADYGRKECVEALISSVSDVKREKDCKSPTNSIVSAQDGRKAQLILDAIFESKGEWKKIHLA